MRHSFCSPYFCSIFDWLIGSCYILLNVAILCIDCVMINIHQTALRNIYDIDIIELDVLTAHHHPSTSSSWNPRKKVKFVM